MKEALDACVELFETKRYLAQGILQFLRVEDVKIALAKSIQEKTKFNPKPLTSLSPAIKTQLWQLNNNYNILTSYINNNNVEVVLAMDLFAKENSEQNECAYLYPVAVETSQNKSIKELNKTKDLYYKGKVLPKRMRFGTFLYYRGIISYFSLMESLAWQKNQRPLLGQIAMQIGYLTPKHFAEILMYVKNGYSFGEIARKKHYLSNDTILKIVQAQAKYNCKIGTYFIEQKMLTDDKVKVYLAEMVAHNNKYSL
ncbi:MAG: hypothetical protein JW795_23815 [Chitinivibrionales bacterium]|nr:hypothetical protein [Chitinivibrionales bacterium]